MAGRSDDEFLRSKQKIRESTTHSLQILNETLCIGIETTEELDRQAESLERTEKNVDRINHDLDSSKRMMNVIKSPFHALLSSSSSKKSDDAADVKRSKKASSTVSSDQKQKSTSLSPQNASRSSTDDVVVDQNLDEMSKVLHKLRGVGELMSEQLDDTTGQIDRIGQKMDIADVKMKKVTKDIKKELHKS